MNTKNQMSTEITPQEPYRFQQRHGSTTFIVNVHSSKTNTEKASDKIARLIRNDTAMGKVGNQ